MTQARVFDKTNNGMRQCPRQFWLDEQSCFAIDEHLANLAHLARDDCSTCAHVFEVFCRRTPEVLWVQLATVRGHQNVARCEKGWHLTMRYEPRSNDIVAEAFLLHYMIELAPTTAGCRLPCTFHGPEALPQKCFESLSLTGAL